MLFRSWRGGELGLILWALVLAVAVVTSVSLLAERIERALTQESSSFLAADLVVRSSKDVPAEWLDEANKRDLHTARMISFASIVFFGDDLHLASIKAVEPAYPLRGTIKRSLIPFSRDPNVIESVDFGPAEGEVWVDARLLPLLNVNLGDSIDLGDQSLKISHILVEEPDGSSYSFIGARVLMNYADIAASGVVQPGSRVTYRYLMAANNAGDMVDYRAWLEPQLDVHDRLITPDQAQESIADTMNEGRRFLLLAGSIGVVLAGRSFKKLGYICHQSETVVSTAESLVGAFGFSCWIDGGVSVSSPVAAHRSGVVADIIATGRFSTLGHRNGHWTYLFGRIYLACALAPAVAVTAGGTATRYSITTDKFCRSRGTGCIGRGWSITLVQQ
jgi:hypothetical protein